MFYNSWVFADRYCVSVHWPDGRIWKEYTCMSSLPRVPIIWHNYGRNHVFQYSKCKMKSKYSQICIKRSPLGERIVA